MPEGVRWLSYPELAAARGISKPSAIRLARRRKWIKRRGNDGGVRVGVPEGEDQPKRDSPEDDRVDNRQDGLRDSREDVSSIVSAFEAGLAAFREQVEAERQRADKAEAARDVAEQAREAAAARQREVEDDAAAWWSRSRWQRLRAAWKGRG
jgi:hypothetical protein